MSDTTAKMRYRAWAHDYMDEIARNKDKFEGEKPEPLRSAGP